MEYVSSEEIERILRNVVDLFLIPRFNELGMNATGKWVSSLEVKGMGKKGLIRGVDYTEFIAKGRSPGNRPPISPIEKWVKAKLGVNDPTESKKIAFAIAKKIEKEGTKWYQKGGSDLVEVLEEPRVIQYVEKELGKIIRVEIEKRLFRQAQEILS